MTTHINVMLWILYAVPGMMGKNASIKDYSQ